MCMEIKIRNVKLKEAKPGFFLTIGETFVEGRRKDDDDPVSVSNTWAITREELTDLKDAVDEMLEKTKDDEV